MASCYQCTIGGALSREGKSTSLVDASEFSAQADDSAWPPYALWNKDLNVATWTNSTHLTHTHTHTTHTIPTIHTQSYTYTTHIYRQHTYVKHTTLCICHAHLSHTHTMYASHLMPHVYIPHTHTHHIHCPHTPILSTLHVHTCITRPVHTSPTTLTTYTIHIPHKYTSAPTAAL